MNVHQAQWDHMRLAKQHSRIPQSMLFVGPLHCAIADFVNQALQLFLCQNKTSDPCGACLDCRMAANFEHPDVDWVKPDKTGGAIKIDQIRELQQSAYLSTRRGAYRIIVIEAADKMNRASANALLKILEEPAPQSIFILIAQQLSTVLPTILSRCQLLRFSSTDKEYADNLLRLGMLYPEDSEQALIMKQAEPILEGLIAVIEGKQHACFIVTQWSSFELSTTLWFLYLVFAQLQKMHINGASIAEPAASQLNRLFLLIKPTIIFNQVDKINTILRKLSHNMNINHTLVMEDLLLGLAVQNDATSA